MSTVESLVKSIKDEKLRAELSAAVAEMKARLDWGLVFERHLPEKARLLDGPLQIGGAVWERRSAKPRRLRVRAIEGEALVVAPEPEGTTSAADAPTERIAREDVVIEHDLAMPVYPVLQPIDEVRNGPDDRGSHVVICGENYDALALLLATHAKAFDVLYLDPPYNTGARDWSYNNDFVDPNDTYRSSKWLAFMERRLTLARELVKDDGVIVVTIDEHEVHHLGMLLETVYPDARTQMVTIVINPSGVDQGGLSRVEEYAFFCFFGKAAKPTGLGDDLLSDEKKIRNIDSRIRWEQLLRAGSGSERIDNPNLFYPVLLDPDIDRVLGVGEALVGSDPDLDALIDGKRPVWPVRENGTWGRWRASRTTMKALIEKGFVKPGGWDPVRKTRVIYYVGEKARRQIASGEVEIVGEDPNGAAVLAFRDIPKMAVKTVWHRNRHNSGMSGSQLLLAFMGRQSSFSYPKSVYAVRDTIDILTRDNKDALILDFFAGSGTTLHGTLLLNAQDDGQRRCFLVTNNEVRAEAADEFIAKDVYRGDPLWEAAGVFESATKPRIKAAVIGIRPDGNPVPGAYFDGRDYSEGFPENVAFYKLAYLEGAEIDYGLRFAELNPLLWLWAGGIGRYEELSPKDGLAVAAKSPYAVLFEPAGVRALNAALAARPDIGHVFVVAASDDTFAQLATQIPDGSVKLVRLYRFYLDAVRSATR